MAVAVYRAEDDIRTAQTSLQAVNSISQVAAVIVKLSAATLNKGTIERLHPLHTADDKHTLAAKLKGRAPLITRAVPTAAGRGAGSSETCFIFPGRGGFFSICLPAMQQIHSFSGWKGSKRTCRNDCSFCSRAWLFSLLGIHLNTLSTRLPFPS